jgi:hypothetical protein
VTIIEIRPSRNGWQVYESAGVQPVFLSQQQAIDYATGRACFRSGEIRACRLEAITAAQKSPTSWVLLWAAPQIKLDIR